MSLASPLLRLLFLIWGVKAFASSSPPAVVLSGFYKHCGRCHPHFKDEETGSANWKVIMANRMEIARRLDWENSKKVKPMPQQRSPEWRALQVAPRLRKDMLAAVLAGGAIPPEEEPKVHLDRITLAPNFKISIYAKIPRARSLALSPAGTLFVSTGAFFNPDSKIYAVAGGKVKVVASGLDNPNGIDIHEGDLYVAEPTSVLKFPNIEANLDNPPQPITIATGLPVFGGNPPERSHFWRYLRIGPDKKIYVSVGSYSNVHEPKDPFATILRMNLDGSEREIFARGVRSSLGFAWHPVTHEFWFTDNGRDHLGDNSPPCELNRAERSGLDFGFPYCHAGNIVDPEFGKFGSCSDATPPAQTLGAHVAPLGLRFYTGSMFPESYRNHIFIAEHGSWNRSERSGYRLSLVRLSGNRAISYETFAQGWLGSDGQVWGRPVDIELLPDGSMLVSDDKAGVLYRISYEVPSR